MHWIVTAVGVWGAGLTLALSLCAAAARADRMRPSSLPSLRALSAAPRDLPVLPTAEQRRLRESLNALRGLVGATHVQLTGDDGELLVEAGVRVDEPDAPEVLAPLFRDGLRVALLTARREEGSTPFSPRQFETVYAIAVVLGATLDGGSAERRRVAPDRAARLVRA